MKENEYCRLWKDACRALSDRGLDFDSFYSLGFIELKQTYPDILEIVKEINSELGADRVYLDYAEDLNTLALEEY